MASRPQLAISSRKNPTNIQPTEIYHGTATDVKAPVKLRIATGGAGQSGLLRALADAFIDDHVREMKCPPFAVSWIKSDTTASFNHLADNSADLSITYNEAAERMAMVQGVACRRVFAWRDHFMFVGVFLLSVSVEGIGSGLLRHCRPEEQPGTPYCLTKYYDRRSLLSTFHRCHRV